MNFSDGYLEGKNIGNLTGTIALEEIERIEENIGKLGSTEKEEILNEGCRKRWQLIANYVLGRYTLERV